ncbi:acyl-CoA dehydrogenase [Histoplasma capsulatum H143]|uniref:Acyl-CoA dehydrogenase n=1 Tax=Ajellomyces capsulatus (strain H143) TaxID=544712 RepID=C6HF45_AJECH|nr:acyl-CoA dehydrogenase [Histoplasma capsulatum H143]
MWHGQFITHYIVFYIAFSHRRSANSSFEKPSPRSTSSINIKLGMGDLPWGNTFTCDLETAANRSIEIYRLDHVSNLSLAKICSKFPDEYWLNAEESKRYPLDFQAALAKDGWLGICMPTEYGGSQLGVSEAAVMMQTISESGASMAGASSVHINIFGLEPVVKFGNAEQKRRFLIPLVQGRERACFGATEPNTGLDTLMSAVNGYAKRLSVLGYAAMRRAAKHANERQVFRRPIGQNQGIQHPLADSWMSLEAARLMVYQAARMYDAGYTSGEYANAAKYLAAEAACFPLAAKSNCPDAPPQAAGKGFAKVGN